MTEIRVATQPTGGVVPSRPVPIAHLLVAATSSGSADTLYTVRTGVMLKITRLSVANVTGSAATLSLNAIPSGGSIGDGNAEMKAYSVAANTAVDLSQLVGGLYEAGTVLKAYSGTTNALVLHGWGEEVL